MPRQDVPYGGAICRLKERIAELFDLVGQKLHSINGVEGDGQGDVKILSDDPAVVITNDAAQNEIKIGLDSSELPSAAVTSVNGATGDVVLDAADIHDPQWGNLNVHQIINGLNSNYNYALSEINTEKQDRQNADSALQTNINQVQAGIPAAAAAAVAADPTVAQLAVDVPNKVDKITSGSTKRAYTHTGAVQDDTPVVDGTDANSIGLRDANGRMQGADPASGATDKTFTTANWVSQTGDNSPNNLAHRTGDESINGRKNHQFTPFCKKVVRIATTTNWWKLWEMDASGSNNLRMWFRIISGPFHFYIYVTISGNGSNITLETFGSDRRYSESYVKISRSGTNLILWLRPLYTTTRIYGEVLNETNVNYQSYSYWNVSNDTSQYNEPTTQDYDAVITATYNGA